MSVTVSLVTIYQVMNEDNDGRQYPANQFFERAPDALEASKGGTWSGKGLPPREREAVRFPDGTIRLLGEAVIPDGAEAEREKAVARAKLTPRERELLGVDK